MERWRDGETERQGDRETERLRINICENLPAGRQVCAICRKLLESPVDFTT